MGALDAIEGGRPPRLQALAPMVTKKKEMEYIRRVFDEDAAGKKLCSIISPREDAQMFRSMDRHSVPCECIVELYELLWRWGHRNTEHAGFANNFGFAIPDTIVIVKGKPYAWYFISKKDGALLRKTEGSLSSGAIEKKLCRERGEGEAPICASWLPMASQFPEARCHSQTAEFLSVNGCRDFLANLRATHSGIIQAFVEPHGVANFLVRTVQYRNQTSLCVRTNRSLLAAGRGHVFDRAATFEGWEGLSSSCSRYRSHRHPHMEDLILAAGETLSQRIEQERVRQMLFLEPTQHVALHFKVTEEHMLFFIYASVVSEKEVILQTRPQLLMGDPCMTEALPCAALLQGGTDRKATPHEAPSCVKRKEQQLQQEAETPRALANDMLLEGEPSAREASRPREGSLPPIRPPPQGVDSSPGSFKRRAHSARRRQLEATLLPRMAYARPEVPVVPYQINSLQHSLQESGRYEYMPPYLGQDGIKQPLITPASARSEPPLSSRQHFASMSARSESSGCTWHSTSLRHSVPSGVRVDSNGLSCAAVDP